MRKSLAALAAMGAIVLSTDEVSVSARDFGLAMRERDNRPRAQRSRRRARWYENQLRGFPGAKLLRKARDGKLGLSTIR